MGDAVIGALNKRACVLGKTAGEKNTGLVERGVVVASEIGRRGSRLGDVRMSKGTDREASQRDAGENALTTPRRIPADLEGSPEWGELRPERANMTSSAGLARLRGERR